MESQVRVFHRLFSILRRGDDRVRALLLTLLAAFAFAATPAHAERIKDLGNFQGVRPNQLTGYGIVVGLAGTGDDSIDDNFFVKNLSYYAPFMEAVFIALGCLVPVFLNIAMNRRSNKSNNFYAWVVVGTVAVVMVAMMYMSSRGVKDMDYDDKRRSLERTLRAAKDRVALQMGNEQENRLGQKVDQFIAEIKQPQIA